MKYAFLSAAPHNTNIYFSLQKHPYPAIIIPLRGDLMKKKTDELLNEITQSEDIAPYIYANQDEFLDTPLHVYLKELLSHTNLKVSQVAELSQKGEYIYQIFRGIKNPSRDVVLSIALAMNIGPEKTKQLLRIARLPALDARNRRDSIVLFALNRNLSVMETNDILYELKEPCL